jgi:drug/metabolite transporter (DMT)-like permease
MLPSFLTVFLWAFTVVCANRAARLVGGAGANFVRLGLATVLLAAWAHIFGKGLQGAALPYFIFSGCVGFGLGDIGGFEAMPRLGPRLSSLMVTCISAPVAAVIEWLWLGTSLTPLQLLLGAVILAGVAVALAPREHVHLNRRQWLIGGFFGLLGALGQGYGAAISRKGFQVATAAGQSIDAGTATYQRALGGLVVVGTFLVLVTWRTRQAAATEPAQRYWRAAVPWIVAHVLTGPTLGVTCFQWALATTPSGIVLPIVALTPLAVIPFAYVMDGDRPSARSLAGGAVAVAGSVALTLVK